MSNNNEIKKALYKEKPIATIRTVNEYRNGNITTREHIYNASLKEFGTVIFKVPEMEMGYSLFDEEVPAQLLIRWMV